MAFLNNTKFKEIFEASKNGNEKAKLVMQSLQKNDAQDILDGLVNDYYAVPVEVESNMPEEQVPPVEPSLEVANPEEVMAKPNPGAEQLGTNPIIDISPELDRETDGLLDENEIDDTSFSDFLKNKKRDALRSKKNNAYFGAFALDGRNNYVQKKINDYTAKFDNKKQDIARSQRDYEKAFNLYENDVNTYFDDDVEMNMDTADAVYNDISDNERIMKSFGRHWDDEDNDTVKQELQKLVVQYGKKNVQAALNQLKSDTVNYNAYRNNQIDTEINRYSKSLKDLLK